MRVGFNSQGQSNSNFKRMVGQLAYLVETLAMTVENGKFPNQPMPNPKAIHEVITSSPQQYEKVKAIMAL